MVATFWLAAPFPALAWNFTEHTELGAEGYQAACDQIAREFKLDVQTKSAAPNGPEATDPCVSAEDPQTVRWCVACRTFSPQRYGQAVAIAGDHVGSPEELMSPQGQAVASNVVDYTFLALVNWQHFHPAAPQNWRDYHGLAVEKALELATGTGAGGSMARDFRIVFYTSAFADHFLQDAFSAGHAGFNRPSTGAVASKAFHDIWNKSGRLVKSPTGACWIQFGDGKLLPLPDKGRRQINAAEKASVLDVLQTFVAAKRDPAREVRPVYFMPSEIMPSPLPESVLGTRGTEGAGEKTPAVLDRLSNQQLKGLKTASTSPLPAAPDQDELSCKPDTITVPIDGMSNPALINGGVDFYALGMGDSAMKYGSLDVLYNHRLWSFMSLPIAWEGGLGLGYLRRDGQSAFAPAAILGVVAPPLYLAHGLWRNELGAQVKGYLAIDKSSRADGYASPFVRSSLEVATVIVRLQAGPTWDFRTGHLGVAAALGLEFSRIRWITGGGALTDF